MDAPTATIEDFYGVYLLCSESPEKGYKGRCYIGYTVNPNRRINQHNRGKVYGGAKKTSNKGPWKMILIVHGFPNNISALQFEWAWQNPRLSSRLKNNTSIAQKLRNEKIFDYNFRILHEMLGTSPWYRMPLIVRWLTAQYYREFPADKVIPIHMKITHGPVFIKKKPKTHSEILRETIEECHLCMKKIENPKQSKITCINPKCMLTCHIVCLANHSLEPGHYVPIEIICPICDLTVLWGDLIRKKNGCNDLEEQPNQCSNEEEIFVDSDSDLENESHEGDNVITI